MDSNTNINICPWKGVIPYTGKEGPEQPFCGRGREVEELLVTIDHNEITTLYGRSGIGKTSLLNAGLFPRLRQMGCFPILLHLDASAALDHHYAYDIVQALEDAEISHSDANEKMDSTSLDYLWNFFAYHSFHKDGEEILPVVVLDQFEEVLRKNPIEATLLLRQLRAAKTEGPRNDWSRFEVNFRFVLSLREDDLFLLEDQLDQNLIDQMKTGRYRLLPIGSKAAADEVVLMRPELFGNDNQQVAQTIVEMAGQSSILLSLICQMAYKSAAGSPITLATIKGLGEKPLKNFYIESISDLSDKVIDYIETKFIEEGRRRPVYRNEIPKELWEAIDRLADEKNERRLLAVSSTKSTRGIAYELLHDRLAEAISEYHEERLVKTEIARRSKKLRKIAFWSGGALLLISCAFIFAYFDRSPEMYCSTDSLHRQEVPIMPKPYYVKDSVLVLKNCRLRPYTFYGNREVRRVELDDVQIVDNTSLFLPNADTLVMGSMQWWMYDLSSNNIPNLRTIIAKRPDSGVRFAGLECDRITTLQNVVIAPEDSDYVQFIYGTLFLRYNTNDDWQAYLTNKRNIYYPYDTSQNYIGGYPILSIDLNHIPDSISLDWNHKLFFSLIGGDSAHHILAKGDVPRWLQRSLAEIDLPYVDTVEDNAICYIGTDVFNLSLSNAKYIGKNNFSFPNNLDNLSLPNVEFIGTKSFKDISIDTISLPNVKIISDSAFYCDWYGNKMKYIYLPQARSIESGAFSYRQDKTTEVFFRSDCKNKSKLRNTAKGQGDNNFSIKNNIDNELYKGYHISNDTLFIDSSSIQQLHIPAHVRVVLCFQYGSVSIERITVDRDNPIFIKSRGKLFDKKMRQYYSEDKVSIVSPPQGYSPMFKNDYRLLEKYICINRSDLYYLPEKMDHVELWVPYGQKNYYDCFVGRFKTVQELSWLQTKYYTLFYGKLNLLSLGKFRVGDNYSNIRDVLIVGGCGLLLLLMLLAAGKTHRISLRRWYIDVPLLIGIVAVSALMAAPQGFDIYHEYRTQLGFHFHSIDSLWQHLTTTDDWVVSTEALMWPTWWISIPLWMLYLVLKGIRFNRNDEEKQKQGDKKN